MPQRFVAPCTYPTHEPRPLLEKFIFFSENFFRGKNRREGVPRKGYSPRHPDGAERRTPNGVRLSATRDLLAFCALSLAEGSLRSTLFRVRNDGKRHYFQRHPPEEGVCRFRGEGAAKYRSRPTKGGMTKSSSYCFAFPKTNHATKNGHRLKFPMVMLYRNVFYLAADSKNRNRRKLSDFYFLFNG